MECPSDFNSLNVQNDGAFETRFLQMDHLGLHEGSTT